MVHLALKSRPGSRLLAATCWAVTGLLAVASPIAADEIVASGVATGCVGTTVHVSTVPVPRRLPNNGPQFADNEPISLHGESIASQPSNGTISNVNFSPVQIQLPGDWTTLPNLAVAQSTWVVDFDATITAPGQGAGNITFGDSLGNTWVMQVSIGGRVCASSAPGAASATAAAATMSPSAPIAGPTPQGSAGSASPGPSTDLPLPILVIVAAAGVAVLGAIRWLRPRR